MRHAVLSLALVLLPALVAACASEPAATPTTSSTSGSEVDGHQQKPRTTGPSPAPLVVAPPVHACIRAHACCVAYVHAMIRMAPSLKEHLDAESTCAGVRRAADAGAAAEPGCNAAIDAWREGFASTNLAVPEACR